MERNSKNWIRILFGFILLLVSTNGCKKDPVPIASFSFTPETPKIDEVISFSNSSEFAESFEWNFGDGNSSQLKDPMYAYGAAGTFVITLRATGEGGTGSVTNNISIAHPVPLASFTIDKSEAKVGESVTFTNTSKYGTSYTWDFGDGSSSTDKSPTHIYTAVGTFSVALNVIGDGGTHSISKNVVVTYPMPVANFTFDKSPVYIGEKVQFTNLSQHALNYSWNFGDNTSSTAENPSHVYSKAGNISVTLSATGKGGTNSITKELEVKIPPYNIVPGVRIGDFVLGNNLQKHQSFITETWANHLAIKMTDGRYSHLLRYAQTGIGFFWYSNTAGISGSVIPDAIYAFSPFKGNTEKGITFGSLLTDVSLAYGAADQVTSDGSLYYTKTLGISFWSDDTKTKVEDIYIAKPGTKAIMGDNELDFRFIFRTMF